MEIKQFFTNYPQGEKATKNIVFCSRCGVRFNTDNNKCMNCNFVYYRNPSPGVVVLIENNNMVLLGRRNGSHGYNKWGLPGGFIEYDEDYLTAAHREVKEETNLEIQICSILNVVTNFVSPNLHAIVIVLLAKVLVGEMKPNDDIKELKWFCMNSDLPNMAFDAERYTIEHYNKIKSNGIPIDNRFKLLNS